MKAKQRERERGETLYLVVSKVTKTGISNNMVQKEKKILFMSVKMRSFDEQSEKTVSNGLHMTILTTWIHFYEKNVLIILIGGPL